MTDGLKEKHRAAIVAAVAANDRVERAVLFGSRATGTNTATSDVDIALFGDRLTLTDQARLAATLDEIPMAQSVDLLLYDSLQDRTLREHIRNQGIEWFARPTVHGVRSMLPRAAKGDTGRSSLCLDDFAVIVMGQSPSGETVSIGEGVALLNGPTEFGPHHPHPVQFTTDPRRYAQPGDLLFCVRGSTTGRMNWADRRYAIGRGVAAIRHRHDLGLQHFIRAVIEAELPELLAHATGSTFPNVSASQLAQISCPSFTQDEQHAIAHILGTLDDKIELNRRMNETLEAMARALFRSWFVDFDPVRAKMEGRDTGLPQDIAGLFPERLVDSELGEIPEGWNVVPLATAIALLSGGTPRTSVAHYWNGRIPWYTPRDAPSRWDVFVLDTQRTITQAGVDNSATKVLPSRTTVISARGTVGRFACLGRPMAMNQTCYGIRGANGYRDFFTYWLVRNAVEELRSRTHGTVFDTITRQTFAFVESNLPPKDVAGAFEATVEPIMERILCNLHESRILVTLRATLLPKLISGEIRVGRLARNREGSNRD